MEWREEAIVLGVRRHGESSVITELMTRSRGRHLGLVRGGRSRRLQPVLQPGNQVQVTWRARLDEHMGTFAVEPTELRAARLMESSLGLHGVQLLAAHLRLLPERDPHPRLYDGLRIILDHLASEGAGLSALNRREGIAAGEMILRFEIELLAELGFGLDLSCCAATGAHDDLAYVSPKSGRAVSRVAGAPWKEKLLPLPAFLVEAVPSSAADVSAGFLLTGYFLSRHVFEPRGLEAPSSRDAFIAAVAMDASPAGERGL
ncbi:DNA repair protein RecO [Consotaella salsifontis]|uniref:DNA repair protein RecO n=1 Tax=Consotaella salsifontis TaxID=1365950 RepID=A0A1T4T6H7_9HYPH|nr:DNA repair protein RecO [Consotaella salsifontis]SKA36072.1 DNA replication and repair protein RecO [Consotaella salsifontis]